MIIYVMRHADAVKCSDILPDEWRYLTEGGRKSATQISTRIAKIGPKPRLTITSPLTRAVQTAEIVAGKACRKNVVIASGLLAPGADNKEVIAYLKGCQDAMRIMLVGHEPQLGALVALLLGRGEQMLSLKKGGCVALEIDPDREEKPAGFLWYLVPGGKKITSLKKAFPPSRL